MEILIAEDDPTSRQILVALLSKWGYKVLATCDGAQAWEALHGAEAPRLAILDWMMPEMDGPELCRRLRQEKEGRSHYTYILLLTARGAKEDLVQGMEAGADDYLVKPFDPQELKVRIRAGQRIVELEAQLQAVQEELRRQSMTDPLTGILNRRAVLERLEAEISRAGRENTSLGLGIVDLDHFKQVNDTFGHLAGDDVLKESVRRVRGSLRAYDVFGRVGGEEFLVVLPGTPLSGAKGVAERLRKAISQSPVSTHKGLVRVTASLGVTVWTVREGVDSLIERADRALYMAKAKGRNRVEALAVQEPVEEAVSAEPDLGQVAKWR
jgi:two-component system cell cycle response regulator